MKLVRFGEEGAENPGLLDDNGDIRDLSAHVGDIGGADLAPATLARLAGLSPDSLPLVPGTPRLGSCISRPGKFIAIGLNYSDHALEMGLDIPNEPVVFMKATSSICGPNDDFIIPDATSKLDWEVELGIIIGSRAQNIDEAQALDHIAGYCVVNDGSERVRQLERGGQWTKGKSHDSFGPVGPWMVTKDEVPDISNLVLTTKVDGNIMQNGTTETMIFSVPYIVAYLSRHMTLEPGDIIATGTPPGVGMGMKPDPVFLTSGQRLTLEIEGLGRQDHNVVLAI